MSPVENGAHHRAAGSSLGRPASSRPATLSPRSPSIPSPTAVRCPLTAALPLLSRRSTSVRSRLAFVAGLVAALFLVPDLEAQNRTVTGRVFDVATQQGVPGAVVTVAGGTQISQATDAGEFRIILPTTDVTLVVRGLGYRRVEVRVPAGQEAVNVGMQREALRVTEIVVS